MIPKLKRVLISLCCFGICGCVYFGLRLTRTKDFLTKRDHTDQFIVKEQAYYRQADLNNTTAKRVGVKVSEVSVKTANPFNGEAKQPTERIKHRPVSSYSLPPTLFNGTDMNPKIMAFFTKNASDPRDPYINLHQFVYSLNPSVCANTSVFLMMVIHSAPGNAKKRDLIRKTYGSLAKYRGRTLAHVFIMGRTTDDKLQNTIINESKLYGDIVQGNLPDSYSNLPQKHIMSMDWYIHHCNSSYILKLDDDVFINPYRVIDFLAGGDLTQRTMFCTKISGKGPVRSSKYKSYISYQEYPFDIYPSFCLGYAYITTPECWYSMHEVSKNSKALRMDDVFVSTALAMKAGVRKEDFGKIVFDCWYHMSHLNIETLRKKAIVIDRANRCGSRPFHYWDHIKEDLVSLRTFNNSKKYQENNIG
ncbi:UDP-GalNAc:beta-1,3-N-acetylgalactosaminyltransferase 1-like [Haliotis rubra]|uniref:UDP-GalNAc:beta-1, 3-N-acetylgalactosaminyltransferase 1-like n=1 Tax=Haliotis rubra TaxID=36100 RepID=UPI001EE62E3E|nr:UDP-GalNAc:beta-1,3-N-acetylgalactosaminyltransferase 1-like [Haliotis rubra]